MRLWAAWLSITKCNSFSGQSRATCLMKPRNSWFRCRSLHSTVTFPVAISKAANRVVPWRTSRGCVARCVRAASAAPSRCSSAPGSGTSHPSHHNRVLRRVQVQPDDVGDLGHQLRAGEELEGLSLPRLNPLLLPLLVMVERCTPSRGANSQLEQCVTPKRCGGGVNVAVMIAASSTTSGRPGR